MLDLKISDIQIKGVMMGHADGIYALAADDLGNLFSGSADKFVAQWDLNTFTFTNPLAKTEGSIYAISLLNRHRMVIGSNDGFIYVLDYKQKKVIRSFKFHTKPVFDIIQDKSKALVFVAGGDGSFSVWDAKTWKVMHAFKLSDKSIRCLTLIKNKNWIAAGLSDHTIRIFDLNNFRQIQVLEGHDNSVFSLCYHNGNLYSGGRDAYLNKWKLEGEAFVRSLHVPAHNYTINHILAHPQFPVLATASRDKTIKIWHAETLELLKVLNKEKFEAAHSHSVNKLLWNDEHTLISCGDDRKLVVWDVQIEHL